MKNQRPTSSLTNAPLDLKKPVLLVEDDCDFAEVLQASLEHEGYVALWARNGAEALKLAQAAPPSVIVLDLVMPVMDGLEFLCLLRSLEAELSQVPVLSISCFAATLTPSLQLGALHALQKPFELQDFLDLIQAAFSGKLSPNEKYPPRSIIPLNLQKDENRDLVIQRIRNHPPFSEGAVRRILSWLARRFEAEACALTLIDHSKDGARNGAENWGEYWLFTEDHSAERWSQLSLPAEQSIGIHALAAHATLVVQDCTHHPVFQKYEWLRERGIRSFASAPVTLSSGGSIGCLCIVDSVTREFTHLDMKILERVAQEVARELESQPANLNPIMPLIQLKQSMASKQQRGMGAATQQFVQPSESEFKKNEI